MTGGPDILRLDPTIDQRIGLDAEWLRYPLHPPSGLMGIDWLTDLYLFRLDTPNPEIGGFKT